MYGVVRPAAPGSGTTPHGSGSRILLSSLDNQRSSLAVAAKIAIYTIAYGSQRPSVAAKLA